MNSKEQSLFRPALLGRLATWPILCLCLGLTCRSALCQVTTFDNTQILEYPGTVSAPPDIIADNFINESPFTINFQTIATLDEFYATWNTTNYINTSDMTVNTGFQFDYHSTITGLHSFASSFYSPGSISCSSINNANDPFGGFLSYDGYGQCIISATNIEIPGTVDVGEYGAIKITGDNVNLQRAFLNVENYSQPGTGSGVFGLNTNYWVPGYELTTNVVATPYFPVAPYQLYLTNATAYLQTVEMDSTAGTNYITRAVFLQDTSGSNISTAVYFGTGGLGLGNGDVTIQWAAAILDPSSGSTSSNYLYLNDDYAYGASTNVLPITGVPGNFTTTSTTTPNPFLAFFTPATPDYNITNFPANITTNLYDYGDITFTGGADTNGVVNYSVTNLAGQVLISAASNLDLTLAQVTGPYYMSLQCTNNFLGSAGAFIQTPFASLALGNSQPTLDITNVMEPSLASWGGTIQAWNTRWLVVNGAITNDYRVLVVASQLTPQLAAQVLDLILHNTNSLVISDTFNVMRTFHSDAQSITLTTNAVGSGATSLDGELNLETVGIFWQSSTPNLRYLTNNGAIRMQNLAYFGYPFVTNVTPAVASMGTLNTNAPGTNVVQKDEVTIGTNKYYFVKVLTNTVANQIAIATNSLDGSLSNLIAAINGTGFAGTNYSSATVSNASVAASALQNHSFTLTARTPGTAGNSIPTVFTPATKSTNLTWRGHATLFGGAAPITNVTSLLPDTAFINNGIFMDQGSMIYAGDFVGSGIISNGAGSFQLASLTTTLTNLDLIAGGDITIAASNLFTGTLDLQVGRSLTLSVTNELSDTGTTNSSTWLIGSASSGQGLSLPVKPALGDLLNTAITLYAPTNTSIVNTWAGVDRGFSSTGFSNNEAVAQLTFDVATPMTPGHFGVQNFYAAGVSNALYVDLLVLTNYATQGSNNANYDFPWLKIHTNMMIYFAQALSGGTSVAESIDEASKNGQNGGRLRWIYSYTGALSSTNLVYTNLDGSTYTNVFNAALAASSHIDSDSDGRANNEDPTPFFVPQELNFNVSLTNFPAKSVKLEWTTIPNATNVVYYSTNLINWLAFTNFKNWYYGSTVTRTNGGNYSSFLSPQAYYMDGSLPDNAQQTNVWIYDSITNVPHYYKVQVQPWLNNPE